MKIAIDVESGERSPFELIEAIIDSTAKYKEFIFFVIGNSNNIKRKFPKIEEKYSIKLIHTEEVIYMDEKPAFAVTKKKNSTVNIGIRLLKNKEINAFFSPGNTGATVVSSVINLGLLDGIKKPALATFFPRLGGGETLIIDVGANPDATVENLYQNAVLGSAYYTLIWGKESPTVGLLNMGVETEKGTLLLKKTFEYLNRLSNFIGNVEGYNVFNGSVDVVVCNGFTGNVVLKIAEATKKYLLEILPGFVKNKNILKRFFYIGKEKEIKNEVLNKILPRFYGGAPVLGVKGLVLVGHGACRGKELMNAIDFISFLLKKNYLENLQKEIKKFKK